MNRENLHAQFSRVRGEDTGENQRDIYYNGSFSGRRYKAFAVTEQTPNWRPLSDIALVAEVMDGMLDDSREQYETLIPVKDKPHVLDDETVERIERLYNERADEFLDYFDEQLVRWRGQSPHNMQSLEIARLTQVLSELKRLNDQILNLAAELKKGTINRILEKSDAELGLEFLMGKHKF